MRLIVYFDYTCAFSYVAAVWLREVEALERDLTIVSSVAEVAQKPTSVSATTSRKNVVLG